MVSLMYGANVELGWEVCYLCRDILEIMSVFSLHGLTRGMAGTDRGAVWYEEITDD